MRPSKNPPTNPSNSKPNTTKPGLNPHKRRRCYKCQGFRHIALNSYNRKVVMLAKYQLLKKAELREEGSDKEVHLMKVEEQCVEEVDKGELLVLSFEWSERLKL